MLELRQDGLYWPAGCKNYGMKYIAGAKDMRFALEYTTGRRTVIQAGGHMGAWALWLADKFEAVITFEPHPDNFEALARNTMMAGNVSAHNLALSDKDSRVDVVPAVRGTGGHHVRDNPDGGMTVCCAIDTMDLHDVDLIVLDIEGFELPALLGALKTIQRSHPVIMVEDRGHGVKKGRGDTFADLELLLSRLSYQIERRIRHDVIFSWVKP